MIISEFESLTNTTPRHIRLSWEELRDRLSTFETVSEKSGKLWAPAVFKQGASRSAENVVSVSALCFDFDHVERDISHLDALLADFTYCAHTTFSCAPDNIAFRVVIPFDSPVKGHEFGKIWDRAFYWLSSSGLRPDRACRDASRIFYWPQQRSDGAGVAWSNDGEFLNPEVLPELPPPPKERGVRRIVSQSIGDPMKLTQACIRKAQPGKRAVLGFWLARKLRDGGVPRDISEECLLQYQAAVGDSGFTRGEALNAVKQAYKRAPSAGVAHAASC